ncbi:hypothetical protein H2200_012188 [Cladophialophora chaetospira]|uniref:Uncharacterized protein n=1 Tax=Cladophialophora chaetospira TaxID=386627 RepID=A0AA39CCP9_9EURO|nr:hypothetical protein H2200_012188 [Cladophialophora chaetospira]
MNTAINPETPTFSDRTMSFTTESSLASDPTISSTTEASQTTPGEKRPPRSLQCLSAEKYLEALKKADDPTDMLCGLSEDQRQVVLPHLLQDYKKLSDVEVSHHTYQRRREYFASKWRYIVADVDWEDMASIMSTVGFAKHDLVRVSDPETPLVLCSCWKTDKPCSGPHPSNLDDIICGRRLFNRITSAFGHLPKAETSKQMVDDWVVNFAYWNGPKFDSTLNFTGYENGTFGCVFDGRRSKVADALELINWLATQQVPHHSPQR